MSSNQPLEAEEVAVTSGEQQTEPGVPTSASLLHGLRRRADEAQLTQAIAAVARADRRFAAQFVALLLGVAADGSRGENARAFAAHGLPDELDCRAEESLGEEGRVDLRFDADGWTLFVENKLYSGYGHDQVGRYVRALGRLRSERSALLAVTRTVPTYGEVGLDKNSSWLGSVRWAHLLPQLRELDIADLLLRDQWRLFVDILDQQGDLGMTRADSELICAWARYRDGRRHLMDLLDQVWPGALEVVRQALFEQYGKKAPSAELVDIERRGKQRQVIVQRDQTRVFLGFCIPAVVRDAALQVQFSGYHGVPHFTVQAKPWNADGRLAADDRQLAAADETLRVEGFKTNRTHDYWARVHEPDEYLDAEDVPKRLIEIIEEDVPVIVRSGILDHDVELGLKRARGGPASRRLLR